MTYGDSQPEVVSVRPLCWVVWGVFLGPSSGDGRREVSATWQDLATSSRGEGSAMTGVGSDAVRSDPVSELRFAKSWGTRSASGQEDRSR